MRRKGSPPIRRSPAARARSSPTKNEDLTFQSTTSRSSFTGHDAPLTGLSRRFPSSSVTGLSQAPFAHEDDDSFCFINPHNPHTYLDLGDSVSHQFQHAMEQSPVFRSVAVSHSRSVPDSADITPFSLSEPSLSKGYSEPGLKNPIVVSRPFPTSPQPLPSSSSGFASQLASGRSRREGTTFLRILESQLEQPNLSLRAAGRPDYIEPYSNFQMLNQLSDVVWDIGTFLDAKNVNFTFHQESCEFRCQVYFLSYELIFRVFIYDQPVLNYGFTVEFQRLSGSCIDFNTIYSAARNDLTHTQAQNYCMELPAIFHESPTVAAPLLVNLASMATSECLEEQYEGTCALASLAVRATDCSAMLSQDTVKAFMRGLQENKDPRIQRSAASGVADLLNRVPDDYGSSFPFLKSLTVAVIVVLLCSTSLEVIRETARALVALTNTNVRVETPELANQFSNILSKLEETNDATAIHYRDCLEVKASTIAMTKLSLGDIK